MNLNDIALLCDALSLKEKERPARILDTKLKYRGGVEIEPIKGNIFAFYFKTAEDRQRVQNGEPWSFDRAIIAFEKPAGTSEVCDMKFNSVDFWVQIHNISLLCMTEEIGMFLGSMIGVVRNIDLSMTTDISGRFLKVRVMVPIAEPLPRSLRVDLLDSGNITTMLLRYERLFDYCFRCGRLGHIMEECADENNSTEVHSEATRRLRVWLRASSPPKRSFMSSRRGEERIAMCGETGKIEI
ncbi:hypothetical protein EZV62_017981 [Acer yangbiense]|uniref:CCHC-type domain-containing protein n=1 Tax=Acer yangbiense TaxID=1000413 RepID=A0A5C7HII3_9ROSI|nr:hypothetical protein EZV62_017981 [Acer yangbiense]